MTSFPFNRDFLVCREGGVLESGPRGPAHRSLFVRKQRRQSRARGRGIPARIRSNARAAACRTCHSSSVSARVKAGSAARAPEPNPPRAIAAGLRTCHSSSANASTSGPDRRGTRAPRPPRRRRRTAGLATQDPTKGASARRTTDARSDPHEPRPWPPSCELPIQDRSIDSPIRRPRPCPKTPISGKTRNRSPARIPEPIARPVGEGARAPLRLEAV